MSWKAKSNLKQLLKEEVGTVIKDWGGKTSVALLYPNTYSVGMSNLGVHNVYRLLNERDDVVCERVFAPSPRPSPQRGEGEVFSVESQRPLADFDIVAVSIAYENDIDNLKDIFNLAKISAGTGRPRIIAGGAAATLNSQLFKGLVDEVAGGDFERTCQNPPSPPFSKGGQGGVKLAHNVIWTPNTEFGSMHLVELQRGCPHRCKFCAAPIIYNPFKQFSKEEIIAAIDLGLPHRKKIGLIGGDVFAHPDFIEVAEYIHSKSATFSPSSVRADRITPEIARLLKQSGHKTITLAPEAGSESLRKRLGKNISDEKFLHAAQILAGEGIRQFKLYFMMGLPEETDGDIEAIEVFVKKFQVSGSRSKISVSVNPFVPKRGTEFEKEAFAGVKTLKDRTNRLKKLLGKLGGVKVKIESPITALHEYELQK